MKRRDFMTQGARAALGTALVSLSGACSHPSRKSEAKPAAQVLTSVTADMEKQVPAWMEEQHIPGVSIALIQNAELAWRRGFGFKDASSRTPVDNDTVFEAGSMSKPVFAYTVLKLCEKGVLDLDTPLTRYTPQRFLNGDPRLDLITPRHILSHTSGFQNWRSKSEPLKIHFTPGEKFLYSGEGYFYLQSVITHLKGRVDRSDCDSFEDGVEVCATDIDEFLAANLLRPFGMASSAYSWNAEIAAHISRAHDESGKPTSRGNPSGPSIARYAAAGGLLCTPSDYAKFLMELLSPKPSDAFRLKHSSVREMFRPQIRTDYAFPSSWALGWQVNHAPEGELVQHGGDNPGFHSYAVMSLPHKSACVIMTNGDNGPKLIFQLFSLPSLSGFLHS